MTTASATARGDGTTIKGALVGTAGRLVVRHYAATDESDPDPASVAGTIATCPVVAR